MRKVSLAPADTSKPALSKSSAIENTSCPIFLRKTYHLIDTCDNSVAGWSDDGKSFLVRNVQVLASTFLPQYFKHNQFSSFVRQLNFYGFRKEKNEFVRVINQKESDERRWQFRHDYFIRGQPELMSKITRRIPNKGSSRVSGNEASTQTIDQLNSNILNEEDRKECQSIKSEIASLEDKLNMMENSLNELSKTLSTMKLANDEITIAPRNIITNETTFGSRKRPKIIKSQPIAVKNIVRPENIVSNTETKTVATVTPTLKGIPTVVRHSAGPTIDSKHLASNVLPDLSLATDNDLMMEDVTYSSSSRSSSAARNLDRSQSMLEMPLDDIDDLFASITECDLSSAMTDTSKREEVLSSDEQLLPSLIPPEEVVSNHFIQSPNARTQVRTIDKLLRNLPPKQRQELVNKILTEMSTNIININTSSQGACNLEIAAKGILSYYENSKGINEDSQSKTCSKDSSKSFVKIEVSS